MPLVAGAGVSYSPLLYRERAMWPQIHAYLTGEVTQPAAFASETPERLDADAKRIDAALDKLATTLEHAKLDALLLLVGDRCRTFDATNTPQVHVFAADALWGDPALSALGEPPARREIRCDAALGELIAQELAYAGFDIAESRGAFRPVGDADHGATPALLEPVFRLRLTTCPIVPIHINTFVDPCISAHRMAPLGEALARAVAHLPQRVGMLASGGLSGDHFGPLAGWIDDVFDRWLLDRLVSRRPADLGRVFDVTSMSLAGTTREVRLWAAAGAAMHVAGALPSVIDYIPLHHAATGLGFMLWEIPSCR